MANGCWCPKLPCGCPNRLILWKTPLGWKVGLFSENALWQIFQSPRIGVQFQTEVETRGAPVFDYFVPVLALPVTHFPPDGVRRSSLVTVSNSHDSSIPCSPRRKIGCRFCHQMPCRGLDVRGLARIGKAPHLKGHAARPNRGRNRRTHPTCPRRDRRRSFPAVTAGPVVAGNSSKDPA